MGTVSRRRFMGYVALGMSTPYLLTACGGDSSDGGGTSVDHNVRGDSSLFDTEALSFDSARVFDFSVASADPTTSGVMLWTHIADSAYLPQEPLFFQVSSDNSFADGSLAYEGEIEALAISSTNDFTVQIDLDGLLQSGSRYYYRFVYDNTASRVGLCRTAPAESDANSSVKFAVLTCQDYTNGYYATLSHLATVFISYCIEKRQKHVWTVNYITSQSNRECQEVCYCLLQERRHQHTVGRR